MTRRAPLAAALAAGLLVLPGCSGHVSTSGSPTSPQLGTIGSGATGLIAAGERKAAPALSGTTLSGDALNVASLRGKVVVLNFWASWCGPCQAEADNLATVAQSTSAKGVAFVGVDIRDELANARAFERKHDVPYPSIRDEQGALLTRFRTLVPEEPPTTVLLDRQGRLAARFLGGLTESELLGPVQALAAESA